MLADGDALVSAADTLLGVVVQARRGLTVRRFDCADVDRFAELVDR